MQKLILQRFEELDFPEWLKKSVRPEIENIVNHIKVSHSSIEYDNVIYPYDDEEEDEESIIDTLINSCINKFIDKKFVKTLKKYKHIKVREKIAYIEALYTKDKHIITKVKESIKQRMFSDKISYTGAHCMIFPWIIPNVIGDVMQHKKF